MSLSTAPSSFKPTREALMLHTLAFASARQHFDHIELVTDELGLVIADRMRWDYGSFRLDLCHANPSVSQIWSSGKLYAQLAQKEPYAHIDNDFILIDPLPAEIVSAKVFVQSKDEPRFYLAAWAQEAMKAIGVHPGTVSYNTGIVGGQDLASLHEYCHRALDAMKVLANHPNPHGISILAEQSVLGQYFRDRKIKVAEMIPLALSTTPDDFKGRAFSHLWGHTKRDALLMDRVEARLKKLFPQDYRNFTTGMSHLPAAIGKRRRPYVSMDCSDPYQSYCSSGYSTEAVGHTALASGTAPKVAVVLICHQAYLKFLPAAVESINQQGFDEKIVVFDLIEEQAIPALGRELAPTWDYVSFVDYGNPNQARNDGLAHATCPWVCFWDADNVMPPSYLTRSLATISAAKPNVAVCYPEVQRIYPDGSAGHIHATQAWSLEAAQKTSLCDTSSFWRKFALDSIGGWPVKQIRHDDYALALRLFRAGWEGLATHVRMYHTIHGENRSKPDEDATTQSLWTAWSFGIVTLWGGQSAAALTWLLDAELPPDTALYWVDNSDGVMTADLQDAAHLLRKRVKSVTIIDYPEAPKHGTIKYLDFERHARVAALYNSVFPKVTEEIVITLEDDIQPPLDGIRRLLRLVRPGNNVACATGVYRARHYPAYACMARDKKRWTNCPSFADMPSQPFEIGMTGGGFALWANWALRKCLPMRCSWSDYLPSALMGWDGNLGLALNSNGYKLLADPSVYCNHCCKEVIEYEVSVST